ncbi:recombinase family protein [Crossiella sp. SN42]|uniref:recombinase family protein n=1 Tax=Crossiella sp. SN42 TaxID=2944808 RepID=UPI00207CDC24|nr:recombinase family protein [Crossiella sp. SN42]MCO1579151.1 recombinase family protein [Crossiella sp. SN42]
MCRERLTRLPSGPGVVAVGYGRVAHPADVQRVRARLTAWCAKAGYEVLAVPIDTGRNPRAGLHRPGLTACLDIAALLAVDVVVMPTLWHLSRDPHAAARAYSLLAAVAQVLTVGGPSITELRERATTNGTSASGGSDPDGQR